LTSLNNNIKYKKKQLFFPTAAVAAIVPVFFNDDFAVLLFFGDIGSLYCVCALVQVYVCETRGMNEYI
jgi:hypothetical protein